MPARRARGGLVPLRLVCLLAALGAGMMPALACETPGAVRDLSSGRFYTDANSSVADQGLVARREAAMRPLRDFMRDTQREADRHAEQGDTAAGACALARLAHWAKGGALLGSIAENQGWYDRKWALAGLAIAYLKVKPLADARQRGVIEPWLARLGHVSLTFFDDPRHTRNNHYYWVGFAAGVAAKASGDAALWQAALAILRQGLGDVNSEGHLPLELARKGKALHYHAFAGAPLVGLALLAQSRGERLDLAPLHRLVRVTIAARENPAAIAALAGAEQEIPQPGTLSYLGLYAGLAEPGQPLPPHGSTYPYLGGRIAPTLRVLSAP
jgi:poly(beta-D-mannuronate) lyase